MSHSEIRRASAGLLAVVAACGLFGVAACSAGQATAAPGAPKTGRPAPSAAPAHPAAATPPPRQTPRPHRLALAGTTIVIDPGHNGGNAAHPEIVNQPVDVITEQKPCDTTGAQTDAGYPEHAFNFDVALRLAALLRHEGARVVLTRYSDTGVGPCITQRAAIGNQAHADVAISIHADGGPPGGSGFEVIEPGLVPGHTDAIVAPSRRLGLDIRNSFQAATAEPYSDYIGTAGLGVRTDLGGLNLSGVPKVFIECADMRNAADAARVTSAAFRQRAAEGLAAGLTEFLRGH